MGLLLLGGQAFAQTTASSAMKPQAWASMVTYNISDQGEEQPVRWGIDTAWRWSWWPLRATNHMQECVSLGRVTLDPRVDADYTSLSSGQQSGLNEQLGWLAKSGVKTLYLLTGNATGAAWQTSYRSHFVNDIALAVQYLQGKGYTVTAISPFNEPDYYANNAPEAAEMATVARLMRQHPVLKDIDVAGPSTLNPDYAYSWWNTMKNDLQIGNTHQLAGTFDSFAGFYAAVKASGKKSAGDEMHNINDALIGMNYGMTDGIWWSDYGGYTRAELGRASNDGVRIGYKENRSAWTSAAVFRRKSQKMVEAFLGTSERQAGASAYSFVSQDRLVYYDGMGPCYDYTKETQGGTGYGVGQTNSEYVIEITHGEDVPVGPIQGSFKLQNKATGKLLTAASLSSTASISQAVESKSKYQTWNVKALDKSQAGDFSYVTITNANNTSLYLDGVKYGGDNGATVMLYNGGGNECERWHLRYMGNGYYVITNHDSGLSLEGSSNNSDKNTTSVVQWQRTGSDRQLWRLIPADATVDNECPAVPTNLQAEGWTGSIALSWDANADPDLLGYMVYRYNEAADEWETIGRQVTTTQFIDNICLKKTTHRYRIRAVDKSWNISEPSMEVTGRTTDDDALVAQWDFRDNLEDASENLFHAVGQDVAFATSDTHEGITFNGTSGYVSLPYHVGNLRQMTFSAWVKTSTTQAWQRIFDFGRNTKNYLFLTPSNGSRLRFEICKDGNKQGLDATKRLTANSWTHVVLTIGDDGVTIYIDGKANATTSNVTFRPTDIAPSLCFLGRSFFDGDPLFQGVIGHVRLYNHALSETEVQALYYQQQLDAARELAQKSMYNDVRQTLADAIAAAEQAIAAGMDAAITSALSSLNNAMNKAKSSGVAYEPLGTILAWSKSMAESYPQDDLEAQETYQTSLHDIEEAYLDGTYTHAQISQQVTVVKTFTNQYLMADAQTKATENNPVNITHLISNPDFAENTIDGWTLTTNSTSYKGACSYGCFEVWNHTFNLHQSLPGFPKGTYRLTTQAFYRNGSKENSGSTTVYSQLYIGNETATIAPICTNANTSSSNGDWYEYATNKKVPNNMEAAAAAFNTLRRYRPTSVLNSLTANHDPATATNLIIGMKKTKAVADDWTIANYFQLYYLGDPEKTSIRKLTQEDSEDNQDGWHSLDGYRLGSKPTRKGIYIKGNKKIIIP